MEKDKFTDLLKEDLENIRKKLEGLPESKKIIGKILRANEFGIMECYRTFFQEIGLSVVPKEWDAINGRHIFVHGEALFDKNRLASSSSEGKRL